MADDDEAIRYLLSAVLTGAGFDVNAASDGQQAWEALVYEPYDLLVTDNEMPRLAGIDLIARMHGAGMSLPVIIASGSFPMERVQDHPELQIVAALPKPFNIGELLNIVKRIFQSSGGIPTADQESLHERHANPQPIH